MSPDRFLMGLMVFLTVVILGSIIWCGGCSREKTQKPIVEGNLYALPRDGKPGYVVLKILKVDEHGYHVRIYSNVYPQVPQSINPDSLFMIGKDEQNENQDLGIGHMPVSRQSFRQWELIYVQKGTVEDSELEGYNVWKEAEGGYF